MPLKRVFRLIPPRRKTVNAKQLAECYARSGTGQIIVRLRLSSPTALLMPFEGYPKNFGQETDEQNSPVLNLNKDFVEYLFARLKEVGDEALLLQFSLGISGTEPAHKLSSAKVLQTAIQRYFSYLQDVRRQDLQKLVTDAALLGLLGVAALGLSVVLDARGPADDAGIGVLLLNQGITVFGWLTLWEALANLLWHWRPLYQQLRMCQRIQHADFELHKGAPHRDG